MISHKGHYLVYLSGHRTSCERYECIYCKIVVRKHNVIKNEFVVGSPALFCGQHDLGPGERFVGTCDEEKIRSIIE